MTKKYFLIITFLISCPILIFAQNESQEYKEEGYNKFSFVGLGIGTLSYFGDLSKNSNIGTFSQIRAGYNLNIEKRLGNYIGVSFNGLMGELSHNQISTAGHLNFETDVFQAGINLVAYMDNDKIINRKSLFTPFFSAGLGYFVFDPKGDLTDATGNPYYYWNDGSIRSTPETDTTLFTSNIIQRDYTYETTLKDSSNNYTRGTFTFPLSAGLKFKLSNSFDANISATFYLTQSDFIDNIKANNDNDKFVYTSFSIQYNLGYAKRNDKRYESIDFTQLDRFDYDQDDVPDIDDKCQNTPIGVEVDSVGCPIDTDNDGVPDYVDKQVKSYKGAMVDAEGVALTSAMMAERLKIVSSAAGRKEVPKPNRRTLKESDSQNAKNLPEEFRSADINGDGYISTDEITIVIDNFFKGELEYTAERLNKLIDYFFEQ